MKGRKRLLIRVEKDKYRYASKKCEYCGRELERNHWYHERYGTCDAECYMYMVGMSYRDFY